MRITDSVDLFLSKISGVIRDNIFSLCLGVTIVCVAGLVVFTMLSLSWDLIKTYRMHQGKTLAKPVNPEAEPDIDDIAYKVNEDGLDTDLPPESEGAKIASKMAKLKTKYASYNAALSAHLLNNGGKKGAQAKMLASKDNIMDGRMLSRKHD